MEIINTINAPKAIWPYSQAIKANWFIFTSWQIALDPKTMQVIEWWIENQTKQVLSNLEAVLISSGANKESVIKTTIFLKNIKDFQIINWIYEDFFKDHKPARSTIEVSRLPKDVLIEIELVASFL